MMFWDAAAQVASVVELLIDSPFAGNDSQKNWGSPRNRCGVLLDPFEEVIDFGGGFF